MGALVKLATFSAPVIVIALFLTFFLNREHVADQRVDETAFDHEFSAEMSGFHSKRGDKKLAAMYDKKAVAALKEYSSARHEQAQARKKVEVRGEEFEASFDDLNRSLEAEIRKGGL